MSIQIALNARQQQVLSATIRHYIATADPVGSEALVKEYDIRASSATVRNAMGFLEKAGLLYQPHISAGRVPSDSGYRTYVDRLLQPLPLTTPIDQLLTDRLQGQSWSVEAVFKGASQILATLSGYITLITLPLTRTMELKHVQLVPVDHQRIMMIVVMDTYETESVMVPLTGAVMDLEADLLAQELQVLSNFLNEQLRGRSLSELQQLDWRELGQDFDRYGSLLTTMLQELDRRFTQSIVPTQLMISGVADVLKQPEFSELQQLQTILHLLEAGQSQLFPLIFETPSHGDRVDRRVTVRIGTENILEPIRSCTLISSNYNRGPIPLGSVSILGPTRMDYESTIALVEATADYLSERLR
jgi:heat-inducible transcriptional repressor